MRGTGGKTGERLEDDPARRGPLSPIGAAAVVLSLLLIAGSILFLATRSNSEPPAPIAGQSLPTATPSEAEPLTESEAIAIFKELDELRLTMYRNRDRALIPRVLTPASPLQSIAKREIAQLIRQGVRVRTRYDTKSLEILDLDPTEMRIQQVVLQYPKFVDENGRDVTSSQARPVRKVIVWTLHATDDGVLIHNSRTVGLKRTRKSV